MGGGCPSLPSPHQAPIEAGPIGRFAERTIALNGLADRVTIVRGLSTDVRLPEPVDVIVSETVGIAAFDEGILAYLADARGRFLAPGGRVVPRSLSLVVAPVRDVALHERLVGTWRRPVGGFDVASLLPFAAQQVHFAVLAPGQLAAAPARAATVDLGRAEQPFVSGALELELETDGPVTGFGLWFDAELADGIVLASTPSSRTNSWVQGFLPLQEPIAAARGDTLQLELATHNGQTWRWRGHLAGRAFDLNTLAGTAFDPTDLQGDDRRAQLGDRGRSAREALALFDGRRTIAEVARALCAEAPDQFPSEASARTFVARLARQFGK